MPKILIATDHAGFELKEKLIVFLKTLGYEVKVGFRSDIPSNEYLIQAFEQGSDFLTKLDILSFGKVVMDDGMIGRVFFLGKVVTDQHDTHTFIHLFTMVFENTSAAQRQIIAHSKMRSSV